MKFQNEPNAECKYTTDKSTPDKIYGKKFQARLTINQRWTKNCKRDSRTLVFWNILIVEKQKQKKSKKPTKRHLTPVLNNFTRFATR